MKIITAANSKGGAGKSIMMAAFASVLHHEGKRVRAIDLDPQGTFASWLEPEYQKEIGRLLITAPDFEGTDTEMAKQCHALIQEAAKDDEFDYLLIDTKGESSIINSIAMCLSDLVITPSNGHATEFDPLVTTYASYKSAARKIAPDVNPSDRFRVVFTKQPYMQAASVKVIKDAISKKFRTIDGLMESSAYNEAYSHQMTLADLMKFSQEAEINGPDATIRKNAARSVDRCKKALENAASVFERLIESEKVNEPV